MELLEYDDTPQTKICTSCKCDKLLNCFGRAANMKDGHRVRCKECVNSCMAQYRATNPEYIERSKARDRDYYRSRQAVKIST